MLFLRLHLSHCRPLFLENSFFGQKGKIRVKFLHTRLAIGGSSNGCDRESFVSLQSSWHKTWLNEARSTSKKPLLEDRKIELISPHKRTERRREPRMDDSSAGIDAAEKLSDCLPGCKISDDWLFAMNIMSTTFGPWFNWDSRSYCFVYFEMACKNMDLYQLQCYTKRIGFKRF